MAMKARRTASGSAFGSVRASWKRTAAQLVLTSVAGEGTNVRFTIPLERGTEARRRNVAAKVPCTSAPELASWRGHELGPVRPRKAWSNAGYPAPSPFAVGRPPRQVEAEAFGKRSELGGHNGDPGGTSPPEQRRDLGRAVQEARATLEQLFAAAPGRALSRRTRPASGLPQSERLDLSEAASLFAGLDGPLATRAGRLCTPGPPSPRDPGAPGIGRHIRFHGLRRWPKAPKPKTTGIISRALNMPPHHPFARGMFDTFYPRRESQRASCYAHIPRPFRSG